SFVAILEDPQVADDAHGDQADVEVGQAHAEEREPREQRVTLVEPRDEAPEPIAGGRLREDVDRAATEMPARMAGERVGGEEDDVDPHDAGAHAEAEAGGGAEGQDVTAPARHGA